MSSIVTEQGILHYESIGRGKPLILLHGWINSWDVWRDSMLALSAQSRIRLYALDFWGFGDSAKSSQNSFEIDSYVEMVHQFMDTLGILRAPIFGHSMGGTVAMQFALTYPQRISKIAVVGSPVNGESLNLFLKLSGYGWIAELVWRYPFLRDLVMRMLLAGDSKKVKNMISRDVQRANMESFFRSIDDLRRTDLRADLPKLDTPILGIYGARDNIVSPKNANVIDSIAISSQVAIMKRSRHFPMTDEPDDFLRVLTNFLEDRPLETPLKIKPSLNGQGSHSVNGYPRS